MVKHYFPVRITWLKQYRAMLIANKLYDESISKQRTALGHELWYTIEIKYHLMKDRFELILNSEETKPGNSYFYTVSKLSQLRDKVDEFVINQADKWKQHKHLTKGKFIH